MSFKVLSRFWRVLGLLVPANTHAGTLSDMPPLPPGRVGIVSLNMPATLEGGLRSHRSS